MKTLLEYLQSGHITQKNTKNDLAHALAISVWSFCDNNELSDKDFILNNSDNVLFKPKGMSVTDAKLLFENFNKNYKEFSVNQTPKDGKEVGKETWFYLGSGDPNRSPQKDDIYILMINSAWSNNIQSIYMSFDVQDELLNIAEEENIQLELTDFDYKEP